MEDAFNSLKEKKKNNVNGVIEWFKEAKIIDGKKVTEDKVKKIFSDVTGDMEYGKFKEKLDQLAADTKTNVDSYVAKLCETGSAIENAFEKMQKEGTNNVDNIMKWMKESKLMDGAKESEEKARKFLADMKAKTDDVDIEKFKAACAKMAEDKTTKVENFVNSITDQVQAQATGFRNAFGAATSAFKDAMSK